MDLFGRWKGRALVAERELAKLNLDRVRLVQDMARETEDKLNAQSSKLKAERTLKIERGVGMTEAALDAALRNAPGNALWEAMNDLLDEEFVTATDSVLAKGAGGYERGYACALATFKLVLLERVKGAREKKVISDQ